METINPLDITYKIANNNVQLICDGSVPNLTDKASNPGMYLNGMYYVPNWANRMAFIQASYEPNYEVLFPKTKSFTKVFVNVQAGQMI